VRVIAGSARGTRLQAPNGLQTRPTSDRVKESLFSIISSRFEIAGLSVLDICAGSGALGIEALSRGARFCCFIEQSRFAITTLEKNLVTTGFRTKSDLLPVEASEGVGRAVKKHGVFDLVFFDPPYTSELYDIVPGAIESWNALLPEGIVVVESSSRQHDVVKTSLLLQVDRRVYGDTALEFYMRKENL